MVVDLRAGCDENVGLFPREVKSHRALLLDLTTERTSQHKRAWTDTGHKLTVTPSM